jgi:hypothetical protein
VKLALIAALVASPVFAQDSMTVGDSTVSIAPGQFPEVAVITFINRYDGTRQYDFSLFLDGLEYGIHADLGISATIPDTIVVQVPEGYVAIPETLTIPDMSSGVVNVYKIEAVGM